MRTKSISLCGLALLFAFLITGISSCHEHELVVIENNNPPFYDETPTLLIHNYINKLFIDLLGREATDEELAAETETLRAAKLNAAVRISLIRKLQTDTSFRVGDSSYKRTYHKWLYALMKSRLIEGASDDEINERIGPLEFSLYIMKLEGDSTSAEYMAVKKEITKLKDVLKIDNQYYNGQITITEAMRRLAFNAIFDEINMNTFNYIRATFDNLFYRFPTDEEFNAAFPMIEANQTSTLWGKVANSKEGHINIIAASPEISEGLITWAYETLLARKPNSSETYQLLPDFLIQPDFQKVQQAIMMTDEYAHFD